MLREGAAGRRPAPGASAAAIRAHYDAGNDFFAAWLDPTMSYSAALWQDPVSGEDGLEAAQIRKMDWHLDNAGVAAGSSLLDIGCGWGGVISRAVAERNAALAVGMTPAREQAHWIADRLARPRLRVLNATWQAMRPEPDFDAIVSIGALEHFARPGLGREQKIQAYAEFFEFCSRSLRPGGRLSLQFIGWMDVPPEAEALNLPYQLFPESNLPRLHEVVAASERRFHLMRLENAPEHYVRTLKAWTKRLSTQRDTLAARHGRDLVRRHLNGFRRFALGFERGALGLYRVGMSLREPARITWVSPLP